ncbi:hypothetical protein [Streptomyces sp. TLI_146]|uniref:hypothetical protein n=1 Tax=Streptomyces sp. TLI_146 TaxID=1938858 RepID=UPI000C702BDD|nr:hypothetical protein [Streptomyces sp. TLI_146]
MVHPWFFEPALASDPANVRELTAMQLAAELAGQLLGLLRAGKIRPGDLLYDVSGAVLRPVGEFGTPVSRSSLAGRTSPVIVCVAHRYGLLRHRPVRDGDPSPPEHPGTRALSGRSWEISPAAHVLAPVVAAELALDLNRT